MSKAADVAKTSVKGGFHVMWGLLVSTIISAVGSIILALVLGANNYGLYAVVLTAPTLIGLFQDLGMNYAVTRYTARFGAEDKLAEARRVFLSGFIFKTLMGVGLSISCLLLSPYLAVTVFHRPLITPLIEAVSFIILAQALVNTATAAFTGVEKMHINSVMVVCQSIIRTVLAPLLVLAGLELAGAVIGYTIAYLVTAVVGVLLVWVVYKNLPALPSLDGNKPSIWENMKVLLRFGLPLSFGDIVGSFLSQFYAFILAAYVADNVLIGNYNLSNNFMVLITFIITPISTMLFPAFSKIDGDKEPQTLRNVYQSSVKYSTLLAMPVIAMMMALAAPGVTTIFGHAYTYAPFYIALLAINYAFIAVGYYSTNSLINSQEQGKIKLILALATVAMGVPLGLFAVSQYGVIGMLVTLIFDGAPSVAIGLWFIKKRYNVTVDWASSGKITLCSAIAGGASYFVVYLPFATVAQLLVGLAVFLMLFITMITVTKVLNHADIANLRNMTSGLGPLYKAADLVFRLIERFMEQ